MTRSARILARIVTAALLSGAPLSLHSSPAKVLSMSVDRAEARVGRPLTPMSVAGVHRRVHRRAYYGAAAVGSCRLWCLPLSQDMRVLSLSAVLLRRDLHRSLAGGTV